MPQAAPAQRGIQSIEVGGQLLHALADHGRPMALKDLALAAGMAAAKAHPYLVSLGKVGLVEQDRATGRYGLGPLALQLGLMSLHQAEPVRMAAPLLQPLAAELGHTVALALWGNRGPTIVQLAEPPAAVHVNMRQGTVFSLADTASGLVFAAHMPPAQVRPLYEAQAQGGRPWARFEAEVLADVRRRGLAGAEGAVLAGVNALAAPVFDHRGAIVLALTTIAPAAALPIDFDALPAQALRRAAQAASRRLGHRPEAMTVDAPLA